MYFLLLVILFTDQIQYNGQEGVELAIKILRQELRITMALAG
jgi:(S)-2-hydroxy-acid oxidase